MNLFDSIKVKVPGKNVFDLSHDHKFSCQFGRLVPTLAMEVLPGEKFNLGCEMLVRMAPMLAPIMHRCNVYNHYWFVPNRILWDNWEEFITGKTPSPAHPFFILDGYGDSGRYSWAPSSLWDYMGIPKPSQVAIDNEYTEKVNALPFAAYKSVYAEWYRDQNYITNVLDGSQPESYDLVDGDNYTADGKWELLRKRAWEHDYFTSALPNAQAGAAIDIPLGEITLKEDFSTDFPTFRAVDGSVADGVVTQNWTDLTPPPPFGMYMSGDAGSTNPNKRVAYDPEGTLEVNPVSINALRTAFRLQEWAEKTLRSGNRYTESIFSHFGERAQDMRLQRPEYITGTMSPMVISEVLNTTGTLNTPQGNMSGHGISVTSGKYGFYRVREHGWIMCITSIMPKTAYQDGLERKFTKESYLDYYWPEFAHLGEQAVLNKEVYAFQGATGENTWGYNPRWSELKFINSRVSGAFRDSLDFWHMGRKFANPPAMNKDFVEMDYQEVERVFAVETDDDALWCHIQHRIRAVRPMPKFGTPSF